jgi:hypothetical protein
MRSQTDKIDSKLADLGTPLGEQLGRYLRLPIYELGLRGIDLSWLPARRPCGHKVIVLTGNFMLS